MNPNLRGAIAEAAVAYEAVRAGVEVLRPLSEHCRYDLVFGLGSRLLRVQCKSATRKGEVVVVRLTTNRSTPGGGYIRTRYTADEVDLVAAHCHELGTTYLLPVSMIDGMVALQLRLSPPRNGQRAAIHFASNFEFQGAVAQLARAPAWHAGGRGFESHQLHSSDDETVVGAYAFRNHFGYWIERASQGPRSSSPAAAAHTPSSARLRSKRSSQPPISSAHPAGPTDNQ